MVSHSEEKILSLAKQGNLQAIGVWLNQHLKPWAATVKLKCREECLQVLLQVQRISDQQDLIQLIHDNLLELHPTPFQTVKIYQPQPGKTTASLIHEFEIPDPLTSTASSRAQTPDRYSVAEFLAHISSIEDLKVLKDHPFFTGKCPQCSHGYEQLDPLPVYWDCPKCGWLDDLSQLVPEPIDHESQPKTTLAEMKRLGSYLVEAGLLTDAQIQVALADQQLTGMRLGEALVRRGWIKEETIEYLMQKVVMPERSTPQNTSYLEISRNLVKTLLTQQSSPAQSTWGNSPNNAVTAAFNRLERMSSPTSNPKVVANERETLVLPDVDMNDYLDDV